MIIWDILISPILYILEIYICKKKNSRKPHRYWLYRDLTFNLLRLVVLIPPISFAFFISFMLTFRTSDCLIILRIYHTTNLYIPLSNIVIMQCSRKFASVTYLICAIQILSTLSLYKFTYAKI